MNHFDFANFGRGNFLGWDFTTQIPMQGVWGQFPVGCYVNQVPFGQTQFGIGTQFPWTVNPTYLTPTYFGQYGRTITPNLNQLHNLAINPNVMPVLGTNTGYYNPFVMQTGINTPVGLYGTPYAGSILNSPISQPAAGCRF
jgi:hypothetical protein